MNEDEMQNYLNRKIDLLNPIEVNRGILDLKEMIEARNLVIHTRYWSIVYGSDANCLKKSIQAGINVASTRFRFGDNFSVDNYEEISNSTKSELGSTFANEINDIFDDSGFCVPGYDLNVLKPSTIGLGDAFVGGFVGSLFKEI
jgi:ADP-dependent phosphofructokinase/glucokinase